MGLYLRFANSLEELFEDFVENSPLSEDPFDRVERWAGSPSINEWLNLKLTERFGVVADYHEAYLDAGLWSDLGGREGRYTAGGKEHLKMLEPGLLQWKLIEVLDSEGLSTLEAPLLKELLEPGGREQPVRKVQVATRLASLFVEYERNRPELYGRDDFEVPVSMPLWQDDGESWQIRLWRRVFNDGGLFPKGRDGVRWLTLPQLLILRKRECFLEGESWTPLNAGKPLCIFALPKPSHFHRSLIQQISEYRDVHLWVLNPCAEFWEDVQTKPMGKSPIPHLSTAEVMEEELPFWETENPLLQSWGKVAKENVALWCQASDYDFRFIEASPEDTERTALSVLQKSLRERRGVLEDEEKVEADSSVIFVEAPGPLRELEAMRDLIIQSCLPKEDHVLGLKDFRPEEAVLLLANPSEYRVALESVFKSGNLGDVGALRVSVQMKSGADCHLGQAMVSLVKLLRGEFTRGEVFSFLRNPLVYRSMGMSREDLANMEDLMISLNTYRAWDVDHRVQLGDEAPVQYHTWKYGFDRLKAGLVAEGTIDLGEFELPVHRAPFLEAEMLVTFMECVEKLFVVYSDLNKTVSPEKWVGIFNKYRDEVLMIPDDNRIDLSLKRELDSFLKLWSDHGGAPQVPEVYLQCIEGFIKTELPRDRGGRAGRLVLAPLKSTEVIPSRMVLIAGLDQSFPGANPASAIDLIAKTKRVGDADPVAGSEDAFLTALHAAKERLVLSRSSRDIEAERELSPSSVWVELRTFLEVSLLKQKSNAWCWQVPLLARECFSTDIGKRDEPWPSPFSIRDARLSSRGIRRESQDHIESSRSPEGRPGKPSVENVEIKELVEFLIDPFVYAMKRQFGFFDGGGDDNVVADHEPLALDPLKKWSVMEDLFDQLSKSDQTGGDVGEVRHHHFSRGTFPEEPFLNREFAELEELARDIDLRLRELLAAGYSSSEKWREEGTGALELKMGQQSFHLGCHHPPILLESERDELGPVLLKKNSSKVDSHGRHMLELWLMAVWLRAMGETRPIQCVHIGKGGSARRPSGREDVTLLAEYSKERAKKYLSDILMKIQDASQDDAHRLHMPYKMISAIVKADQKIVDKAVKDGEELTLNHGHWGKMELEIAMLDPNSGYESYHSSVDLAEGWIPEDVFDRSCDLFSDFLPWPYAPREKGQGVEEEE